MICIKEVPCIAVIALLRLASPSHQPFAIFWIITVISKKWTSSQAIEKIRTSRRSKKWRHVTHGYPPVMKNIGQLYSTSGFSHIFPWVFPWYPASSPRTDALTLQVGDFNTAKALLAPRRSLRDHHWTAFDKDGGWKTWFNQLNHS